MVTRPFTWEGPLTPHSVAAQLKQALFGPLALSAPQEALRAEVLRLALWEYSVLVQHSTITEASVSTQHILNRARDLWMPLAQSSLTFSSPQPTTEAPSEGELSRYALDEMAEQGDLLSLPQGRWLPAPLRLVPITSDVYLLVGGMPSSLLASPLLRNLRLHGSFRQIDIGVVRATPVFDGGNGRWQFQTRESWLGASAPELSSLLNRFHNAPLLLVERQDSSDDIEIYVASLNRPQGLRWRSPNSVSRPGRYLLRSQTCWGQRYYSIGLLEQQQLKEQSQRLDAWDIRRLCYALDSQAHTPTKATWNREQGLLTLRSELPVRERKLLATLGMLQKDLSSYYPRIWEISPSHEQEIHEILKTLHIQIEE